MFENISLILQIGGYISLLIAVYWFGRRALVQIADIYCVYALNLFRQAGNEAAQKISVLIKGGKVQRVFCEYLDEGEKTCTAQRNKGKRCILHER